MFKRLAALLGIVGAAAAVGAWLQNKKRRHSASIPDEWDSPATQDAHGLPMIDLDDDAAANIIKRARPALERARKLS
jgi:hypothetical protein